MQYLSIEKEEQMEKEDTAEFEKNLIHVKTALLGLWGAVNVMQANIEGERLRDAQPVKTDNPAKIAGKKSQYKPRSKPNPTDELVIRELSRGGYIAIPTIAGTIGRTRTSVYNSIYNLQRMGYSINTKQVSGIGRRYRKIFKLEGKRNHA